MTLNVPLPSIALNRLSKEAASVPVFVITAFSAATAQRLGDGVLGPTTSALDTQWMNDECVMSV